MTHLIPFKMIVVCKWCNKEINIEPLPVVHGNIINTDRQKELIERHGWRVRGDAFCSRECYLDYLDEKNVEDWDYDEEDN